MRNISVKQIKFGTMIKEEILSSEERNHLCNFGRVHHEEQFCEIILNLDHGSGDVL